MRIVPLVVSSVLLAAAGAALWIEVRDPTPSVGKPASRQPEAEEAVPVRTRAEPALRQLPAAPAPSRVQAVPAAATPPPAPPAPALSPSEEALSERARQVDRLDRAFQADPPDPKSAPAMERRIAAVFQEESAAGSRLRAAECHGRVCRVTVDSDDDEAMERFVAGIGTSLPFDLDGFVDHDRGTPVVTLYVQRGAAQSMPR